MLSFIRKLLGRESYPLNKIYISKQRLVDNYKYLYSLNPNIKIAPVLKSNAYGHGLELVGKTLDTLASQGLTLQPPPFFCVDSLFEAYRLQKAGIKSQILIMGHIDPRSLKGKRLPFHFAVFDIAQAEAINQYQKSSPIHLFIDTGMHREGIRLEHLDALLNRLIQLNVVGLMSHLASSDDPNNPVTKLQLKNFKKAKQLCLDKGLNIKWFHLGGSMAVINNLADECNLIRAGKALYGAGQFPKEIKPALKLTTKIAQINEVKKGEKVGYSGTYTAPKNMRIGILPIGYNDGVDRRLSNKGLVMINKSECPIIGLISMNITTIDLSGVKKPFLGQKVTIFSDNAKDKNSVQASAKICQTIPHDILVHLNLSTRRQLI